MLVSVVAVLGMQAAEPGAEASEFEDRYLIIRESVEPFEVPGRNYRRFYRNVEDYGPGGRFGRFDYHLRFESSFFQRGDTCRAESETVVVDMVFKLPAWTRYEQGSPREREVFDEMYAGQRAFLDGYASLVRRGGYGLLQDLRGLEDMECEALNATMNEIGQAWIDAINDAMSTHEENAGTVRLADTVCMRTGSRIRRCRD